MRNTIVKRRINARRSLFVVLGLISIVLVGLAGYVPNVQANDGFTNLSLQGRWGFSGSATEVPGVVVGVMTFDGSGGCSITETFNASGASGSQSAITCSYAVNPDGTGTLTAQTPSGPATVSFVIVDSRKEFQYIRTDLVVALGVAKRQ